MFGPILPVVTYDDPAQILPYLEARPKPLALYLFTRDKDREREILSRAQFGGGCVNDTVLHLSSPGLPFGGVGASGMGSCHGKAGFEAFSHPKSVLHSSLRLDLPVRTRPIPITPSLSSAAFCGSGSKGPTGGPLALPARWFKQDSILELALQALRPAPGQI